MKIIIKGQKEVRRIKLKLVDGSLVTGMINLIQRGENESRISDIFVSRQEPFVVIFHATLGEITDTVLVINKRHVIWVTPEDD